VRDTRMERALRALARRCGVLTAYTDVSRRRRAASTAALLGGLRALGLPLRRPDDAPEALRAHAASAARRVLEPVLVAWDGVLPAVDLRLPGPLAGARAACRIALDEAGGRTIVRDLGRLPVLGSASVGGLRVARSRLRGLPRLPLGRHRLVLEAGSRAFESTVLAAPSRAFVHPGRAWGVFMPLYALRTRGDGGCGDLGGLRALMDWVFSQGGGVVATLPLLAAFLDAPCEPSPYSPVSRLFWNELYVDVDAVRRRLGGPGPAPLAAPGPAAFRDAPPVDYRGVMAARRRALEALAARLAAGAGGGEARRAFDRFLAENPRVSDYARFRAACERRGTPWSAWPAAARDGVLAEADADPAAVRYHRFVQWAAQEQMEALAAHARRRGPGLYLDFPLGVHRDGYDVWRERDLFALDASGGAPPDSVFTRGQDWGFPPLHPERIREQGYRYLAGCLRHHLRCAGLLRIDHVMGLHRLYWVPRGGDARDGVYVRYAADELHALLCLESWRHRAMVVGENLGTVPPEVNAAMARHRLQDMYTLQYELDSGRLPRSPARDAVCALNTHDMPMFATYESGRDLDDRVALGLATRPGAQAEAARRAATLDALARALRQRGFPAGGPGGLLRAALAWLGSSPARVVLANLEDLWGETRPQNVPSTGPERPNWRRRARYALEAFRGLPAVRETLRTLDRARRGRARTRDLCVSFLGLALLLSWIAP